MVRNRFVGYLVSIFAGLSFGFIPIIIAILRDFDVSVLEQLFLRLFFGGIIGFLGIGGYLAWNKEKFSFAIKKNVQSTYILQGLLFTIAIVMYIGSIVIETPVGEASLLIQIHPLVTLILGALLLNEVIDRRKIFSILLGFTGLILLTRPWEWEHFLTSFLGDFLAILNGILYAIYLVIGVASARIRAQISPALSVFWVLFWGFIWGVVIIIFLSLLPIDSTFLSFNPYNLFKVRVLLFGVLLALFGSILPYGFLMISNKFGIESSIQSILGLGEPIAAIFLGYIFLAEPITIWYLIGGFFLLLAILNILKTEI
ncbi:MAG: DMT family transporter [Candidatus Hodarchaeales archaeon]|jgi:drug/metabolite transporter (DMT)-like permease